jgi:hypothetical protein
MKTQTNQLPFSFLFVKEGLNRFHLTLFAVAFVKRILLFQWSKQVVCCMVTKISLCCAYNTLPRGIS